MLCRLFKNIFQCLTCNFATLAIYSDASFGLSSVPTVSAAFEYNDRASSGLLDSRIFAAFSKSVAADSGLPPEINFILNKPILSSRRKISSEYVMT